MAQTDVKAPERSAEPQAKTALYGDWLLRCIAETNVEPAIRLCEILQDIGAGAQQGSVAALAIGRAKPAAPLTITLRVRGASFPSSVKIGLGDKDPQPQKLAWTRCIPGGCYANGTIGNDVLKRWQDNKSMARLEFVNGVGQTIQADISLRGFSQALSALEKER